MVHINYTYIQNYLLAINFIQKKVSKKLIEVYYSKYANQSS